MARAKSRPERAFETGEAKMATVPLVIQNELHRPRAKTAGAVIEENRTIADRPDVSD